MRQQDSAEWILRTVRRILKDVGPKAARRFIDSRGGPAKWETAAREIARHALREQSSLIGKRIVSHSIKFGTVSCGELVELVLAWSKHGVSQHSPML